MLVADVYPVTESDVVNGQLTGQVGYGQDTNYFLVENHEDGDDEIVVKQASRMQRRLHVVFKKPPPPVVGHLPDDIELFMDLLCHGSAISRELVSAALTECQMSDETREICAVSSLTGPDGAELSLLQLLLGLMVHGDAFLFDAVLHDERQDDMGLLREISKLYGLGAPAKGENVRDFAAGALCHLTDGLEVVARTVGSLGGVCIATRVLEEGIAFLDNQAKTGPSKLLCLRAARLLRNLGHSET